MRVLEGERDYSREDIGKGWMFFVDTEVFGGKGRWALTEKGY